ncbi:MAG: hypothetical protein CMO01_23305 [Thalassobius sp.]|nr:hypothetical protein [Thalassovita sp.]
MTTAKEILDSIYEEYYQRIAEGENYYSIRDYFAFFYIEKYFSPAQKQEICKNVLFELKARASEKRRLVLEKYKNFTEEDISKVSEEFNAFNGILNYLVPPAAEVITEAELIELLNYYDGKYVLQYKVGNSHAWLDYDISSALLNPSQIFDLVIQFKKKQTHSDKLTQKLKEIEDSSFIQRDYLLGKLNSVIALDNTAMNSELEVAKKEIELEVNSLASHKKWKWLQDYPIEFMADRNEFYELVVDLSNINYFNLYAVSDELKAKIAKVNPEKFEVFVLDVLEDAKNDSKKRSGWFLGEKVIAFRVFVWLMHYLKTPNQYAILIKIGEKCFTKIKGVGPTSRKLGDVVLRILFESETIEGLGALLTMDSRNKYPVFKEALKEAIRKAINYTKLNPNEVEDYFISDYDLVDGTVQMSFGEYSSEIQVESLDKVNLIWYKPDKSIQKSVPAKVKNEFANELKLWKAKLNDIKKEFSGQKMRIEAFWRKNKSWSFEKWKKYLLDHQLLKFLTHGLIWQFETEDKTQSGFVVDGQLVDYHKEPLTDIGNAKVTLWHPVNATVEEVHLWRSFMLANEIKQPFKQAFREVYLVTDAEINTSTYSNRFNGHVLNHHKFAALAKQRLWKYDSVYTYDNPFIEFREYKIRITLDLQTQYTLAVSERVHFRNTQENVAQKAEDVPTIVFSEAMRDVDLFVGVCSIGMEDEWNDNNHMNYWQSYSKSELSELAKTRRQILENLIPKLKIKDQCEFTDRSLVVKGKLKTYKIHFGSGNILMEPNDQYLCIIPDKSRGASSKKIFLPFDDDHVLSIILSKALLLADDDKITDPVILNQL